MHRGEAGGQREHRGRSICHRIERRFQGFLLVLRPAFQVQDL